MLGRVARSLADPARDALGSFTVPLSHSAKHVATKIEENRRMVFVDPSMIRQVSTSSGDGHIVRNWKVFGTFTQRSSARAVMIVCRSFLRGVAANRDVSARVQAQDLHAVDGSDISCNFPSPRLGD